ncbi:hypothetical protein ACRALDRAFT_2026695 [Sodiomyces alcalophilus JCM 7366]|uniref:uncharacterized protein n=1 Tax=Sodiomyces alcalophilus JCM 7366 TaxID=591952 RepID=UPI0039B3B323
MGSSDHHRSSRQAPESTSGFAGPHPYYYYKPLPPLPTSDISLKDCSLEVLTPDILDSVLARVGQLLGHIPHAICGDAAVAHYGYRYTKEDMPTQVCILCPSYARQVIRGWAAAAGLPVAIAGSEAEPAFLAVTVPEDKSVRKVRIQWMADDVFKCMGVVSRAEAGTRVLTMPELINDLAGVYVEERTRRRGGGDGSGREDGVARQILWLLGQVAREGRAPEQMVTGERVPNVVRADFWTPFTFTNPGAAALFYDAGFEPPIAPSEGEGEEEEVETARGLGNLGGGDDDLSRAEMESLLTWTDGQPEESEEVDEEMMRVVRGIERLDSIADSDLWRVEVEKLLWPSSDDDGVQPPVTQPSSEEEVASGNSSPDSAAFDIWRAEMESMLSLRRERGPGPSPSSQGLGHSRRGQLAASMPRLRRKKGRYFKDAEPE